MNRSRRVSAWWGVVLLALFVTGAKAQVAGEHWDMYKTPAEAGWSAEGLEAAKQRFQDTGAAAFLVVYDGRILVAWGNTTRRFMCHSVRKSLLSALYGVYVGAGEIDLDETMADLGIDDIFPLTDTEKSARIRDLLKARSGVYHPAAYETQAMKENRPERGSHRRDTFWYYNNWDFNALGAIFEQRTGEDIFRAFDRKIAGPLGMEDYRVMDGYHHLEAEHSQYPAYPFKMSARDLARFGLLFLREGDWDGTQVVPRKWVTESTTPYSATGREPAGYAYLWWTDVPGGRPDRYFALGYGGQVIGVWPSENIVFVQRVDTYEERRVTLEQALGVLDAVMEARVGKPAPRPALAKFAPLRPAVHAIRIRGERLNRYQRTYALSDADATVVRTGEGLLLCSPSSGNFRLRPLSEKLFYVEDLERFAVFHFREGVPERLTLYPTRDAAEAEIRGRRK